MTEPDPTDRGAVHSALNDTEFPDDERGLTGTREDAGATGPEGQTARDVFPEDNGVPDVSQDDFPTMQRSEDPQFAPEPGDRESHQTVDFGTRSEEHTSELQSRQYLVCRLLLEKKKTNNTKYLPYNHNVI